MKQFIATGLPDDPYCQQMSGAPGARVCGQGPCGAISSGAQAEGQETAHGAESASGGVDENRLARLRAACEGSEPMPSTVYREPHRDEADNLVPACGIAVSVLVGMDMWLTIVALVLLLTRVFWGPA
jgi:hypothetical protein